MFSKFPISHFLLFFLKPLSSVAEKLKCSRKSLVYIYINNMYNISIPGSGRSPGGGHSNPLQYSCLENPMDRGAWWATVTKGDCRVTKSQTYN